MLLTMGEHGCPGTYFADWLPQKECGLATGMVYCLMTHDTTYEGGRWASFPPAPWFILALVRNAMYYLHSDWWKFAPLDQQGHPKPLYALPEKS